MIIILEKRFKNHPAGTELDVSPRIHAMLMERGCISKQKAEPEKKKSSKKKKKEKN